MVLWLKLLKLTCVCAFAAGAVGAYLPSALDERRRAVFALALPGFLGSWAFGFWLAYEAHVDLLSTWILLAITASLFGINVLAWSVAADGRRSVTSATLAALAFLTTLAVMVLKPA